MARSKVLPFLRRFRYVKHPLFGNPAVLASLPELTETSKGCYSTDPVLRLKFSEWSISEEKVEKFRRLVVSQLDQQETFSSGTLQKETKIILDEWLKEISRRDGNIEYFESRLLRTLFEDLSSSPFNLERPGVTGKDILSAYEELCKFFDLGKFANTILAVTIISPFTNRIMAISQANSAGKEVRLNPIFHIIDLIKKLPSEFFDSKAHRKKMAISYGVPMLLCLCLPDNINKFFAAGLLSFGETLFAFRSEVDERNNNAKRNGLKIEPFTSNISKAKTFSYFFGRNIFAALGTVILGSITKEQSFVLTQMGLLAVSIARALTVPIVDSQFINKSGLKESLNQAFKGFLSSEEVRSKIGKSIGINVFYKFFALASVAFAMEIGINKEKIESLLNFLEKLDILDKSYETKTSGSVLNIGLPEPIKVKDGISSYFEDAFASVVGEGMSPILASMSY